MIEIPHEFVDVDFTQLPDFVPGDLGLPCFLSYGDSYEETFGDMSDAEIRLAIDALDQSGLGLNKLVRWIFDQGREGSCVANAFTQAHQVIQAKQFGLDKVVRLSPISLYQQIGTSPTSGATVSAGMQAMRQVGIVPLDTAENRERFGSAVMPATGFNRPRPAGWRDVARMFAGLECHVIRSVNGILAALCRGFPVVVGRDGHSIMYGVPQWDGRTYSCAYANSWGEGWGRNGWGLDTIDKIRASAQYAVAVRSVVFPLMSAA